MTTQRLWGQQTVDLSRRDVVGTTKRLCRLCGGARQAAWCRHLLGLVAWSLSLTVSIAVAQEEARSSGASSAAGVRSQDSEPEKSGAESAEAVPLIAKSYHVWGGFEPGAWSTVSIVTQTFDERGEVLHHRNEVKRVLAESTEESYRIEEYREGEATPEGATQISQRWYIDREKLIDPEKAIQQAEINLPDRTTECRVFDYRIEHNGSLMTYQDLFSRDVFPHIIKRRILRPAKTGDVKFDYELVMELVAVEVLVPYDDQLLVGAETRTVIRTPESTTTIMEVTSPQIPGGLVRKSLLEIDRRGRTRRRELVDLVRFGRPMPAAVRHESREEGDQGDDEEGTVGEVSVLDEDDASRLRAVSLRWREATRKAVGVWSQRMSGSPYRLGGGLSGEPTRLARKSWASREP